MTGPDAYRRADTLLAAVAGRRAALTSKTAEDPTTANQLDLLAALVHAVQANTAAAVASPVMRPVVGRTVATTWLEVLS